MVMNESRMLQAIVARLSLGASEERQTTTLKTAAVKSRISGSASDVTSSDSNDSAGEQRHWPDSVCIASGGLKISQAASKITCRYLVTL